MDINLEEIDMREKLKQIEDIITDILKNSDDKFEVLNQIRDTLYRISPANVHPVDFVRWIHIDDVLPNNYNPNAVAHVEMGLLLKSIDHDGYTQPIVTIYDPEIKKYIIVDGFHRYFVMKQNHKIYDLTDGYICIVVIEKDINDRMASTIRHNRARGKHTVSGMSNMVFNMLENGWKDADICNELGMEPEELLRLKHVTGFSKLFEDIEYQQAWVTKSQLLERQKAGIQSSDRNF